MLQGAALAKEAEEPIEAREKIRADLMLDLLTRGPQSRRDLHFYIREFLGLEVPTEKVCEHCCAPFDFVADMFFETNRNALFMASRSGGKTQNFAVLNHLELIFKSGCTIVNVGAILRQAEKCYSYVKETLGQARSEHMEPRDQIHLATFVERSIQSHTTLRHRTCGGHSGKSELEIVTGTISGVNSPHPNKVNFDEIDLTSWSILQEALSMAKSKNGIAASTRLTSTRKFAAGPMQRMLDEAKRRNFRIYQWCVWECTEPCTDKRSCKECEKIRSYDQTGGVHSFWEICKGRLKKKTKSGFLSVDDVVDKFLNLDFETFEAQWLNRRPSGGQLWFPQFSRTRHVVKPFKIPPGWKRFRSIDFGFTNPFVCIWGALSPEDDLVIYREHYHARKPTSWHRKRIADLSSGETYEFTAADPSAKTQRADIAVESSDGSPSIMTVKAINDFEYGIDAMTDRLGLREVAPGRVRPRLLFFETCEHTISETERYQKMPTLDGRAEHERPLKRDDHTCDAVRYLIATIKLMQDRERVRTDHSKKKALRYNPGARKR